MISHPPGVAEDQGTLSTHTRHPLTATLAYDFYSPLTDEETDA